MYRVSRGEKRGGFARVLRRCARACYYVRRIRGGFLDEDLSRRAHASSTARFSHYYVAPRRYAARQILIRRNVINSFIFRSCRQTNASARARARARARGTRAPFVLTLTKLKRLPRARTHVGHGKIRNLTSRATLEIDCDPADVERARRARVTHLRQSRHRVRAHNYF